MSFLSVSPRKTAEIDLANILSNIISEKYGTEIGLSCQNTIESLSIWRGELCQETEDYEALIHNIQAYHNGLLQLNKRLQLNEKNCIPWGWWNADGQNYISSFGLEYELVNLIYSYAAANSKIAVNCDMNYWDSLMDAHQAFETAADMFEYLSKLNSSICGLNVKLTCIYANVMRAHAYECDLKRGVKSNPDYFNLVTNILTLYDDCLRNPDMFECIPKEWIYVILVRQQFYKTLFDNLRENHSTNQLTSIRKSRRKVDSVEQITPLCDKTLSRSPISKPLFEDLVSLDVHDAIMRAKSRCQTLIMTETKRLKDADHILNARRDQNSALKTNTFHTAFGELIKQVAQVRAKGGVDHLINLMNEIIDSTEQRHRHTMELSGKLSLAITPDQMPLADPPSYESISHAGESDCEWSAELDTLILQIKHGKELDYDNLRELTENQHKLSILYQSDTAITRDLNASCKSELSKAEELRLNLLKSFSNMESVESERVELYKLLEFIHMPLNCKTILWELHCEDVNRNLEDITSSIIIPKLKAIQLRIDQNINKQAIHLKNFDEQLTTYWDSVQFLQQRNDPVIDQVKRALCLFTHYHDRVVRSNRFHAGYFESYNSLVQSIEDYCFALTLDGEDEKGCEL